MKAYIAAFCHELFHLLAALYHKTAVREFAVLPYGCRLTLDSTPSPTAEGKIALWGPVFNLLAFLFSPPGYFREINLALLLLNLLPVLPLDGGTLLYAFLCVRHGEKKAYDAVRRIGIIVGIGLFFLAIAVFAFSGNNVSLLILTACLLGHSHSSDEALRARSRTLCRILKEPDPFARTEELTAMGHLSVRSVLNELPAGRFAIVTVIDKSGNILGRFTQKQLATAAIENPEQTLARLAEKQIIFR